MTAREDLAGRVLGWAVRLLPADRRAEWGPAMRAELAQLDAAPQRRRFAFGCLRGSLSGPRLLAAIGSRMLLLGLTAAAVAWTARVTYLPLRIGLVALAAVPAGLAWLALRPGRLGPVDRAPAARLLRGAGYALVGGCALLLIAQWRMVTDGAGEKAGVGIPVVGTALMAYMLAFVLLTRRRSVARASTLACGAVCGAAVGAVSLAVILLRPPLPPSADWVIVAMAVAGVAAALAYAPRAIQSRDPARQSLIAVLCAVTVVALLVFVYADGLLLLFPRWVPDTSPVNVPPADRLANNRAGAEDPYFGTLAIGCLAALALVITIARRVKREIPA